MGKWLLLPLISLAILTGCGPEQTARDARKEEADRILAEKTRIYREFEGIYRGTMVSVTGKNIPVRLKLQVANIFIPNPQTNEVDEVANIKGYFSWCYLGSGRGCKGGTWRSLATFGVGQFDGTYLILQGGMGNPGGGSNKPGNPPSGGSGEASMVLVRKSAGLEGNYDSTNISTTVTFSKKEQSH